MRSLLLHALSFQSCCHCPLTCLQVEAEVQEEQQMAEELQAMTAALQRRYEQQAADVQQLEDGALQVRRQGRQGQAGQ